ncbi:MAG: hypothetical protein EXS48_03015 [Candidatus Staskawiczbacteria bacterium]|nr:hypothetical protein [Candidatus Staskawiczbacteria bacterium]
MNTLSKDIVKKLYYKDGLSTIEVGKRLNVTHWVVLSFMRRNKMARRTFKEANSIAFYKKQPTFSLKKKLNSKEEKLKMAGVLLYWGEGAKLRGENCAVDFANSNPEMIKVFVKFLREICNVNERKLRVYLYCHSNQSIETLLNYWYNITSIPLNQFTKPYVRKDFFQGKNEKMKYGMVHIRYADKKLLFQIDSWIKEYSKFFEN